MPDFAYQKIILKAGECATLPSGASLIYSSNTQDLTSECEIPTTFELKCYAVSWENEDNAPTDDAAFVGVTIDGVFYPLSVNVGFSYSLSANDLRAQLVLDLPEGIYIDGDSCDIGGANQYFFFQSVGSSIIFKVANPNSSDVGTHYLYLIAEETDTCECPPEL